MADNISGLSQIIQSINSNDGILQNMANVCGVIKNLNLNQELVDGAKDKGTHFKNLCNQTLKPVLASLQTVITEANGLSTDNLGTGATGLSGKVTSINNSIKTIVDKILGLTNSNDEDNPSPFQVANGANGKNESEISKAINTGQIVKQALNQLKGSVNKISGGLTDFQTAMDALTIPVIDTKSTDANSLGYKLNSLQIASNNIIDAILGFKNGNTTSGSGENAVEIKLADRVKDVKTVSGQISAFSKALYEEKKQAEGGESSTSGVGLIPNINSFNTNLGKIQEFKIDNIISKDKKLSNKITDSVIAANSINTWLNTTEIGAWNDTNTKQALNNKINHIKAASGVIQNLANSIFKAGAQATEAVIVDGVVISPAVPAGKDTGLYVNLNSLLTATDKYVTIKTKIQGLYAQNGLLVTIPDDINKVFGTLGNGDDDNNMTFMKLAGLVKNNTGDSYEDKIKKLKDVGKVLDKYKFALWKDTFKKDTEGKDTDEIEKSEGLLKTVSDFNGFLTSANVKAALDILKDDAKSITEPLNGIPAGIKAILGTLTKYSAKDIDLLDLETITTYEYVSSTTNPLVLDQKEKGKKTDTKAAGLVGKVIAASAVIKKYAVALQNPDDTKKGLFADLNVLNTSLAANSAKSVTDIDENKIKFLSEDLPGTIKSVLESLNAYEDKPENEFLKLLKETEDVGGQQKTKAEARVKRLQDISKIIKTYAAAISKDNGAKGLVADLSAMNVSMTKVQELAIDQINVTESFQKITGIMVAVTDALVDLGSRYNKDSGKRLQKSLEGLIGYKTVNKDDKGKDILDEKGKATTTSHTGIFAVIGTFTKALQALFKEGGIFEILSNIDFKNIDPDNIQKVFNNTEQLTAIIINSLKKQTVDSDETRLIAMYGEEYIQKIQNITSSINSILSALTDIVDPKKNPLIGNPVKLFSVKRTIEKTFTMLIVVIKTIISRMKLFSNIVAKLKNIDAIVKSYEDINKIFTTVNNILKAIIEMPILILKFIIAAPIAMVGLFMLGKFLTLLQLILERISLIEFKNITKNLSDTGNAIKKITEIFKNLEMLFLHITILALVITPAILAAIVVALGLSILTYEILLIMKSVVKIERIINARDKKTATKAFREVAIIIGSLIGVCVAMIALAYIIGTVITYSETIILGLLAMLVIAITLTLVVKTLSFSLDKIKLKDVLLIILVMGAMTIITGMMIVIAGLLAQLGEIAERIKVLPIIAFIAGLIIFTAILIALGYVMMGAVPILLPATGAILVCVGALIVIVGALWVIAYLMNEIVKIASSITVADVEEAISKIFNVANTIINAIFNKPQDKKSEGKENGEEPWWKTALKKFAGGLGDIVKALMTMAYLAQIVASVYMLKWIAECLNEIQSIELKEGAIQTNVKSIFATADNVINSLSNMNTDAKFNKAEKFLGKYEDVVADLADMCKLFNEAGQQNINTHNLDALVNAIKNINDSFVDIDDKKISNSMDAYSKFLKQIDKTSLNKLETTAKIFEEMAKFSESINGNFEELANTINDKIAPLMEELKELLEGVQQKVEKNGSDISSSVYASSQGRLSQEAMMAQTKREMPYASELEQTKISQQRMEDQMRRQSSDLASKLDELIELFRAGNAQVKMA